jgi:ubiquinone biosynthesis UbiH/UbiF/VisC/COQ6 family hydroxylase
LEDKRAIMSGAEHQPILVHGSGSTARVTALALSRALAQAHVPIVLANAPPPQANAPHANAPQAGAAQKPQDYQSVLALSAASKTMLQSLGVWDKLDRPNAAICDMAVFGDKAALAANLGLDFAPPASDDTALAVLAHIVCRAALARAIESACDTGLAQGRITSQAAPLSAFDKTTGQAQFADGTNMTAALLIDCARAPQSGARTHAGGMLRHDYRADALVCALESATPHGQQAIQIFTADGPLALLPLPDPHQRALIWSLPRRRAAALAAVDEDLLTYELEKASGGHAGALRPITARAVQPLTLALAENYVDEKLCLVGEAAHIIHPLAGQGFNLALRDAAQLAETLFEARRLGLAFDAPNALHDYQALRRADSGMMAMTTHMLAEIFSGKAAPVTRPLARLGLAVTGRLAETSRLGARFRAQADGGIDHAALPRLMRGRGFDKN